jgi:hypothetical protein
MSEALVQLAERCEAATGPDRELDAAIFQAIGAPVPFQFANKLIALEFNDIENAYFARVSDDMQVRYSPPAYTASLDAAMTLVPPEHAVDLTIWAGKNRARLLPLFQDGDRWLHSGSAPHYCSNAATPALALTAAALRALAKEPTP